MVNTILFDLDGTLLSFDQDEFIKLYFLKIEERFLKHGYPKGVIVNALYEGLKAMLENDGKVTNEEAFWNRFSFFLGDIYYFFEKEFSNFYNQEFNEIRKIVKHNEYAHKVIAELKRKNYNLVLATNPLFPRIATINRMQWDNFHPDDFKEIYKY